MSNKKFPDYYPSNIVGTYIVNAVTGISYKDSKVGSLKEKDFYIFQE